MLKRILRSVELAQNHLSDNATLSKDDDRLRTYLLEKFDFLGYAFLARSLMTRKGKHFVNFSPAISANAAQAIRTEVRSWKLPQRSDKAIEDLSRMFNPISLTGS